MLGIPFWRRTINAIIFNELINRSHNVKFDNNVGLPNLFAQTMIFFITVSLYFLLVILVLKIF